MVLPETAADAQPTRSKNSFLSPPRALSLAAYLLRSSYKNAYDCRRVYSHAPPSLDTAGLLMRP